MIQELDLLPKILFSHLYDLLNDIAIPLTSSTSSRRGFPKHRRLTFGITQGRFNGITGLSRASILYPEIFDEIVKIGDIICPFPFTSVHLNHNVTCPPHKDANNKSVSLIVSFGDYTGGKLVIENKIYDAKYKPILFDGTRLTHWNTDDLQGNKYSLVFFS